MDAITPTSVPQRSTMDTGALKKFAQEARRTLRDQVSAKLVQVLAENSAARREAPKAVQQLESEIGRTSRDQVIERVAYTWFNRFTALRFMDANGYTAVRVVTPADGQTRPEILSEAMAGVIGEEVSEAAAAQLRALLDSRTPSPDPQGEAYHRLLVATCNYWHTTMPFMFEKIDDFSELLMPKDLLSQTSILARLREAMTDEACRDVEIIGWLYQFYISEKKDQVFAGLKKNQKITAENIPAATQLFTPHWIVRYLVENSLGRLWLLNRPGSKLAERMDYYIAPEEPETDFLRIVKPEEIMVCDPACGSGHMLTYAFDLLYAIYEEEGYDPVRIPALILQHNLTGVEIDDRAGALAAFALAMKAAARLGRRRFLRMEAKPDIVVLQNVTFTPAEMQDVAAVVGRDLFTDELRETLLQFEQAKNFGSLIVPKLRDPAETLRVVEARDFGSDLLLKEVQVRVVAVLRMAEALSPKYHVVVANPPYAGTSGLNADLQNHSKSRYPNSKSDLFAMFMERAIWLANQHGMVAMINMQSWMFLSSFELLRAKLSETGAVLAMAHLGERAFDSIGGAIVSTTAFVFGKSVSSNHPGDFIDLTDGRNEKEKRTKLKFIASGSNSVGRYQAAQSDFEKIAGRPIVYTASERVIAAFSKGTLEEDFICDGYVKTGNNEKFIRLFWEVDAGKRSATGPWRDHPKGGEYRKWEGNQECVVKWDRATISHYRTDPIARVLNEELWDLEGISWSAVSGGKSGFRRLAKSEVANNAALCIFPKRQGHLPEYLGYLNSKLGPFFLRLRSQTVNFLSGDIIRLPKLQNTSDSIRTNVQTCLSQAKSDWDAYETSWDFTSLPLLSPDHRGETLKATHARLRAHWQGMTDEMQRLEEENNRIFIDAYGLQDELTPEVPIEEITLTCNPAYRYGGNKSEAELGNLLRSDTMREFLSYAVGCMFGRYSPDAPGLILANQGKGIEEYLAKVPEPTFPPDADNVIPILDGDWFPDDITERFRKFLRVTFGEAHFQENLVFIEEALGKKLRSYFTRDFYADHVRRYKKRPIYWLFSSPKGTFNALIYMHRYRPDTVSVVLNDYLREFRNKLEGHRRAQEALSISSDASPTQKTKALKEIEATGRQIEEVDAWERDVLFPLATQKIEIDLDDGVKANYPRFGAALKPIKGLNDADD
ncbi:BREX-1 system adenine-specific DNA-methyltransferase PglX [Aureimonas sp. AU20]|uniref:BREX-1 system adenine-specific DNA-methyltransferase PglX n=1 Tax=Aureimonas sp. AU20 TaxID=1349819 RepID=UPI00071F819D|nr:BREX-1 system adenine-specific DNA-methyltransferase PglX [Aureimonas sp. AU20]ALN72271.1 hypothetical protein M673_06060 [Aureimonas sp. AU20]